MTYRDPSFEGLSHPAGTVDCMSQLGEGLQVRPDAGWRTYVEAWDPDYGTPSGFELDGDGTAERAESGPFSVAGSPTGPVPLAFIDGRRRVELSLWTERASTGERVPGLLGAYAVGAVTIPPGRPASYAGCRVGRLAVWGAGRSGSVAHGGYRWVSDSVVVADHTELLAHLQDRMRQAEGALALEAAGQGWNVVLDGPLNRIRSLHGLVTGYVKTHHRSLLPAEDHQLVPRLDVGERTALYALGKDRYTCYCRVGWPGAGASPWGGIARLEFPSTAGLAAVAARASLLTAVLPGYRGVAHRDPRAPVNLGPVRNLENHLSRAMGRVEYATRAARDAVIAGDAP